MAAGYDPELPGLDEARLDGYRDLIISKIGLLNTALQRDGLREVGEITLGMVGAPHSAERVLCSFTRTLCNAGYGCESRGFRACRIYEADEALAARTGPTNSDTRRSVRQIEAEWVYVGAGWLLSSRYGAPSAAPSSLLSSLPPYG